MALKEVKASCSVLSMRMIPLTPELILTYNRVGTASYHQHYLHLWPEEDPSHYIESSFTTQVMAREIKDPNLRHFLIEQEGEIAGILKLVVDAPTNTHSHHEAMLLEKIYLLKTYSGKGLGKKCINYVIDLAESKGKKILWLDTMKKGRALNFYLGLGFEIFGEKLLDFSSAHNDQRPMYKLMYKLGSKS